MSRSADDQITVSQLAKLLQAEVPIFKALKEADAAELLPYFRGMNLPAGESLWHEGDVSDFLAYVLSGKLELKKETEFKGKQVVVGVLSSGAPAGELSFLDKGKNSLTVEALEDCQLARFSREDYVRLEESRPDLALILVKSMLLAVARRLEKSYERLAAIF